MLNSLRHIVIEQEPHSTVAVYDRLSKKALETERNVIVTLRNQSRINDEILRNIQRDLDYAEARLKRQR
jgi:monovalent cation/hydrogen antiporter